VLLANSFCVAQDAKTITEKKEMLTGFEWLKQFEGTWTTDNYDFSQQFGWVSDKFGVSWQLNLE
jgi:predicted 3-demethylubiquinone-9 3-methyltransferase (glyoxalase superfamily)